VIELVAQIGTSNIAFGHGMASVVRAPAHHATAPLQQDAGVMVVLLRNLGYAIGKSQGGIEIGKGKYFVDASELPSRVFAAVPFIKFFNTHAAW
jgi:hypothetical protein